MKVTKKEVAPIVAACFPEYKGRKFSIAAARTYALTNYWDGGSRNYCVAYDLATGKRADALSSTANPFRPEAHGVIEIPAGVVIVEHSISCGKDVGICIYVRPENLAKLLPRTAADLAIAGVVQS
jgi:hypothetical protein